MLGPFEIGRSEEHLENVGETSVEKDANHDRYREKRNDRDLRALNIIPLTFSTSWKAFEEMYANAVMHISRSVLENRLF